MKYAVIQINCSTNIVRGTAGTEEVPMRGEKFLKRKDGKTAIFQQKIEILKN